MDQEVGFSDEHRRQLREEDRLIHYMYLPPRADAEESLALLFRPALIHQRLLEESERLTQLTEVAVKHLQAKIVEAFTGSWFDPAVMTPDVSDHWNPQEE